MAALYLHGRTVESVFDLLGHEENDITYSIGWALSQSPDFLRRFLQHVCPGTSKSCFNNCELRLQHPGKDCGYTDIEIRSPEVHVIVEAKRGWNLPSTTQLRRYIPRFKDSPGAARILVCMSECSQEYAQLSLPSSLSGTPVVHVGWRQIDELTLHSSGSHASKLVLAELRRYLRRIVSMQQQDSNWVYVLALSKDEFLPGLTWIDVVTKREQYFHPFGTGGWPKEPPNYLGFRYGGQLQSIHHVEKAEVARNFRKFFPECPDKEGDPYVHYRLGPPITPSRVVKTGRIYMNGRVWAMLDLLLTRETISEARDKSYARDKRED